MKQHSAARLSIKQIQILFGCLLAALAAGCVTETSHPPFEFREDDSYRFKYKKKAEAEVPAVATYSIVAFNPETGDLGVAVQSKFFGVGSVVPWAKAGVGAIATQSYANVAYGPDGLALLERGRDAATVLDRLVEADEMSERRQVGIIDAKGNTAVFTGDKCNGWAGHKRGQNFAVQGNLLASKGVVDAMANAFEKARARQGTQLADWLVAALIAGEEAGGDKRGRQSAALLVVRERGGYGGGNDRFVDLRVEDHPDPLEELSRLLKIHKRFYAASHGKAPMRSVTTNSSGSAARTKAVSTGRD